MVGCGIGWFRVFQKGNGWLRQTLSGCGDLRFSTAGAIGYRLQQEQKMKSKLYIGAASRQFCLLAALAVVVNVSTALAQTPAAPANKASTPPPMSTQPMPMEKGTTMSAMPGMAQGGGDIRSSMAGMMKSMDSMKTTGNTDKDFAMMMKIHHEGAIDMAKMELQSGKDATMRAMAKRIIEAQQKEIKEFDQWLAKNK